MIVRQFITLLLLLCIFKNNKTSNRNAKKIAATSVHLLSLSAIISLHWGSPCPWEHHKGWDWSLIISVFQVPCPRAGKWQVLNKWMIDGWVDGWIIDGCFKSESPSRLPCSTNQVTSVLNNRCCTTRAVLGGAGWWGHVASSG